MPTRGRLARLSLAALVAAASLALAACGDDDPAGFAAATTSGGYPLTIASKYGSATIPSAPRRILALDYQSADDMLALGVAPIAIGGAGFIPGGLQEWTKAALAGKPKPQVLEVDEAIPYERIAALRPDLILATNTFLVESRAVHDRLSKIAPTIHFAKDSRGDVWELTMERVGEALGKREEARRLVADAKADVARARSQTPQFAGKTVTFFNADPAGIYVISDPRDYAIRFMEELGLELSPKLKGLQDVGGGRALLSRERYDIADADVLVGTSPDPKVLTDLGRQTLFRRLSAVEQRRYVAIDVGAATSIVYPSLLSVRYATRNVVPKLARAVKGDAPVSS